MSDVLALIPARAGSKGIPEKNIKSLAGRSAMNRAIDVCNALMGTLSDYVVSSDVDWAATERFFGHEPMYRYGRWLHRPSELAQDDTPMIAVVQHALAQIPGPPDQIILLLQPTQPLREPKHLTRAIQLLEETSADSVVSVIQLPATHSPDLALAIRPIGHEDIGLAPWLKEHAVGPNWGQRKTRRQAARPAYIADGTVYAFWRRTVTIHETIYGDWVVPMVIPPEETCALDTMADWAAAERRIRERSSDGVARDPLVL